MLTRTIVIFANIETYIHVLLQTSKMLEDKEFCVINGPSSFSKQDIEKKIVEYGGTIVQNPGMPIKQCYLVKSRILQIP